ncbi:oligosaccharide repeat unit polymerase [Diaminobutyricibacter tongyongensis]|uniref:Oligosaccharide repeat unit polymerase n=1 Tax=Leifsonia tongyongensis TaxID=1268043 RepID=A0A6L9XTD8_9MICO|nr:O-antigen polymerase [Diaminobutyricibacter tongyongensis]NEN04672.1 oligosaccharide repeat unit polymerase [Diaminobutyricibacter tongyongensis]
MFPNLIWCAALVALLVALTFGVRAIGRPVLTVAVVHNAIWAGALALIGTNLIDYKTSSTLAWATLATGLVAFNAGAAIISMLLARGRPIRARGWLRTRPTYLTTRPLFFVALGLYAAAFLTYLVSLQLRFGLATILEHPSIIRRAGQHGGVSYLESMPLPARLLLYLGPVLFAILAYGPALDRPFKLPTRIVGLVVVAGTMAALLQRSNLFIAILLVCALYISRPYTERQVAPENTRRGHLAALWARAPRPVRLVASVALLGIVALAAFQGVGGALGKSGQQAIWSGAVSQPLERTGLTAPFQYYTAGTVAFLQMVDATEVQPRKDYDPEPQTWGASTFGLVLKAVPGVPHVDPISPFIDTGVMTNVYTWLAPYYQDLRLGGVLIGSLLYAMLAGWLFIRRNESQTMFWIQAALLATVFLAPFATRLNSALVVTMIVYVAALSLATRWLASRALNRGVLAADLAPEHQEAGRSER